MINDAPDLQPDDTERAAERESLPTGVGPAPRALGWIPRELRYALRALRRRPGFSVVATLTLGIGIGGLTAIESAADIGPAVRAAVRALDPSIPVYDVHTMHAAVAQSLSSRWLTKVTLAAFAAVALLLAAIGVYGVISLAVAARIREFGIRLAIGARPTEVVHLVLRDGVRHPAALGMAIGLVASAWLTRFLSSLHFATPALDLITFGGVAALLGLVAIAACCGPAYRAARADPVRALKATD